MGRFFSSDDFILWSTVDTKKHHSFPAIPLPLPPVSPFPYIAPSSFPLSSTLVQRNSSTLTSSHWCCVTLLWLPEVPQSVMDWLNHVYHGRTDLTNRNLFPLGFGGWKSKIKVPAGWLFFLASRWPPSPSVFTWSFSLFLLISGVSSSSSKGVNTIRLGPYHYDFL